MSLAIAYVLDAAAETDPDALASVAGRSIAVSELSRLSADRAERFLAAGHVPGDRVPLPFMGALEGVIDALAAARIGLVLCDDIGSTTRSPGTPSGVARDVAESRVFSSVPLAIIAGETTTQGELINAAHRPRPRESRLEQLWPLLDVLGSIEAAMASARRGDPGRATRQRDR